jgi:hypothetical protein
VPAWRWSSPGAVTSATRQVRVLKRAARNAAFASLFAALIAGAALGGCGSGGGKSTERGERGRDSAAQQRQEREASGTAAKGEGEAEAEGSESKALKAIPRSDRVAYVQLGVAASELRTGAAMLSVRSLARRADTLALRQLRPRMEALRPRDSELEIIR